jgi:hypothetical protein
VIGEPHVEYQDHVEALRNSWPELATEIASCRTLQSVMPWMERRGIPLGSVEIVFQDEYSHDFLVPLDEAGRHLAFGIT